jgi:hypothetical protein
MSKPNVWPYGTTQLGDGPWALKVDGYDWHALVTKNLDGTRTETFARATNHQRTLTYDRLWSGDSITVTRLAKTPPGFGQYGTYVIRFGPPDALPDGHIAEHRIWKRGTSPVARRVVIDDAIYELPYQTTLTGPQTITPVLDDPPNVPDAARATIGWRKLLP